MLWAFARICYTILFTLLLPFVFIRLWVRSLSFPAYRRRWKERLGNLPFPPLEDVLWIHAVSVGESLAAISLIQRIRAKTPNRVILITTTTPTGSERVQAAFKDSLGKQIYHCYFPYDLPWIVDKFFTRIKPSILILMETELWPNVLEACRQRKVPVIIANARLSPKSVRRYGYLKQLMQPMLASITIVAAQSAMDAKRFEGLGIKPKQILDIGNIKFDLALPPYIQDAGLKLRTQLGQNRLIWIGASTHDGEEAILLNIYHALKKDTPNLLLFLVPRHPDRFNKVSHLCSEEGLCVIKRSEKKDCTEKTDVFLGDTMGELLLFYAASDVAFMGGSFVPVGGHNLLEPAAIGLPIVTGPQLFNFVAISEKLMEAKGLTVVQNEAALKSSLVELLRSPPLRAAQGKRAQKVVAENKGALDKLLEMIESILTQSR